MESQYLSFFYDYMEIQNKRYDGTIPTEKRDDNVFELEFRDVSFKYANSDTWALRHVNQKITLGTKNAVVGKNGAGKTTFIKLLCRLYEPTEGQILLNGVDIRYYDYEEYAKLFGIVFQDFNLFSFPLGENVAGSNEYDRDRAAKCLESAGFGKFGKSFYHYFIEYFFQFYSLHPLILAKNMNVTSFIILQVHGTLLNFFTLFLSDIQIAQILLIHPQVS